jgi:hypothetical protein
MMQPLGLDAIVDRIIRRRCGDEIADAVMPAEVFKLVVEALDALAERLQALSEAEQARDKSEASVWSSSRANRLLRGPRPQYKGPSPAQTLCPASSPPARTPRRSS